MGLPPIYVQGTIVASVLAVGCGLAGGAAGLVDNQCFPAAGASCSTAPPLIGVCYGLAGAAVVGATERWRRPAGDPSEYLVADRDPLVQCVLVGTLPLPWISRALAADDTVAERAVDVVTSGSPPSVALLRLVGAAGSCTWLQGVLQQALATRFTDVALLVAMRALPLSSDGSAWWWPVVSAGTALAPIAAAALAAAAAVASEGVVARQLCADRPTVDAALAAVDLAVQRCELRFELDAPPEVAQRRAEAFRQYVDDWHEQRGALSRRGDAAAALRAVVAASAYAASGEIIIVTILAWVPCWLGQLAAQERLSRPLDT